MSISEFLDILEKRRLVSPTVLKRLREKMAQDPNRLTPQALLKYLVQKELIDRTAAQELLRTTLTVSRAAESSILGNYAVPEVPTARQSSASLVTEEEIPTLTPIDSRQNLRLEAFDQPVEESSSIFDDSPTIPALSSGKLSALGSFSSKPREESAVEQLLREGKAKAPPSPKKSKPKSKTKRERGKSEWDSSLILYGGGGLLVLLLAGGIIYYLLNRENADFVLEQATESFESGSYTQAIAQYDKFVKTFPSHPQHSEAAVRLGIARLWQDTSKSGDPAQALATAKTVLDDIEDESEFRSSQRDLASLLPKIAQGLATQAEASTDADLTAERAAQTREALALCMNTKYVPKEFRDDVLLGEVEETLLRVERTQVQGVALAKALEEMSAALSAQDIAKAYEIRDSLLDEYPALINDKTLAEKVAEVSTVEGQVVEFVPQALDAQAGDRPSPVVASLTLADLTNLGTSTASGNVAVRVGGAIYGLKASDGSLLWRRFVGSNPNSLPVALPNGDFLVVDAVQRELVRIAGATGRAVWRQAFEGSALEPVIAGDTAYLAKPEGKLLIVALESGQVTGEISFGQGLATPPVMDQSNNRLYLVGEQASLYTINTADNECLGVFYLGHAASSITAPPEKILNKLIIAANTGAQASKLQVLALDGQGLPIATDVEKRLVGTIATPLGSEGRRLVAITSLGEITVFDVANAAGKAALNETAKREAAKSQSVAPFYLLHDGNIWLGDSQLGKLGVQATSKTIRLGNIDDDFAGDVFNHPLELVDDVIIHVRRTQRGLGSIVAATNAASGATVWQTRLAVPLAGPPTVNAERTQIRAITAAGAGYLLDRETLARRVQDKAVHLAGPRHDLPAFTTGLSLSNDTIVAGASDSHSLIRFVAENSSRQLTLEELPAELATDLLGWREGVVAPTKVGQVFLMDGDDGNQNVTPFQPPLEAGEKHDWLPPAVYGSGEDSRLVISEGSQALYLVGYVAEPQPHLEAIGKAELSGMILNTRLAVAADVAAAGNEQGSLSLFKLPSLEAQPEVAIGGQINWGPFAMSEGFLFATDQGELFFVTAAGEVRWQTALSGRKPTGVPLVDGKDVYIAWQLAGVSRLDLKDGSFPATTGVDEALVAGPVAFATRLVLVANDGTLLVINRP